MKKSVSILVIIIAMLATSVPSFADTHSVPGEAEVYQTVISGTTYMDDGSYYVTTVNESTPSNIPGDMLRAASSTKTSTKRTTYYNSSDESMWYVQVTGTFTYNGTTSSCTSSTVSAAAQGSNWSIVSKSASKSGNQATGSATASRYNVLGIAVQTVSKTVIITCSKTGTVS
jgi:PDZ domain-containing secreted protein